MQRERLYSNLSARGQEGEAAFDVTLELGSSATGHGAESFVESELSPVVSHEVQSSQDRFVLRAAKSSAQLLKEDGRALRGAKEQHGVDGGNVDAFVEDVHGEEGLDGTAAQVADGGLTVGGSGVP